MWCVELCLCVVLRQWNWCGIMDLSLIMAMVVSSQIWYDLETLNSISFGLIHDLVYIHHTTYMVQLFLLDTQYLDGVHLYSNANY